MMLTGSILACLIAGASAVPRANIPIAGFGQRGYPQQKWTAENDPVMGGVSVGSFGEQNGQGVWRGEVKIVPKLQAPGFCTIHTGGSQFPDMSSEDGLLVTIEQAVPGGLMDLKVSMESSVRTGPRQGEFEGKFKLRGNSMSTYFIAFADMTQSWRGQKEGGPPTKEQLKSITRMGFNEDGVAGKFEFKIVSIAAGSNHGPAPGPTPPTPNKCDVRTSERKRCGGLFTKKEQCEELDCCYDPAGSLFETKCFHSHRGPGPSPSPSPTPPSGRGLTMFAFGSEGEKAWRVTNDPVMGGRSKSSFTVGTDGAGNKNIGLFAGDVAIVPSLKAPGFCNAFVEIPNKDASAFDAFEITLLSHGPLTAFKSSFGGKGVPKDPNCHHPGCQYETGSYKAGFNVTQQSATAPPQRIIVPFTDYTYEWSDFTGGCTDHGAKCCDPTATPNTCPTKTALSEITQIGIWGEGTAGDFALDIFSVKAVKMKGH